MTADRGRLRDGYGRDIDYVRVSITERCDYRCVFCMPSGAEGGTAARGAARRVLTTDETLRLCRILAELGVGSFKVTGGEPFMNPDAMRIIAGLKPECGASNVTVTTNGSTLDRHIDGLLAAHVDCVNVSLNGMTPEVYARASGCGADVNAILRNIVEARRRGLCLKINMVPIRGVNGRDIVPLLEFAFSNDIAVRFIELMPIGEGRKFTGLSRSEVQAIVESAFGPMTPAAGRLGNGPAAYCTVPGKNVRIGYIAALSDCFCEDCNRIRLTSAGFLKTCLHHADGVDLADALRCGENDGAVAGRIRAAVAAKPERHRIGSCPASSASGGEPMHAIGG